MRRYAVYARKSDDDTSVTEKSIGEQLLEADSLVARFELDVVWRKTESKSAKVPDVRPVWRELVGLIEAGEVNSIVCWHINRLVRNMKEGGHLVQLLIDGKIKEIRTPHAFYQSGDNILPIVIEAATATQYSLDLGNTVKRAMVGKFKAGGCNHRVRPGYRNIRDPFNRKRGLVEKDDHRFVLIRKAWDLMLTGNYTVMEVWRRINFEFGFRTRRTRLGGNVPLGKVTLYKIFRDPFYAGYAHYKGAITLGSHEPMVTTEEFERMQGILAKRSFQAPRREPQTYTGLMRCGYCGRQITAESHTLTNGNLWQGYHCSDSKLECTKKGLPLAKVEGWIMDHLATVTIDAKAARLALEEIERSLDAQAMQVQTLQESWALEIALVEGRLRNLAEMWIQGLISDSKQYRQLETAELKAREALVLNHAEDHTETGRIRSNARAASEFVTFARDAFLTLSPERRREVARALAQEYTFYGREKLIEVTVRPILSGFVQFARDLGLPLESTKSGSEKQNEPPQFEVVHFGGASEKQIELPDQLLEALRDGRFPNFGFGSEH